PAARQPNAACGGPPTAATRSVGLTAERAAGPTSEAPQAPTPPLSAWKKTTANGRSRSTPSTSTATAVRPHLSARGSATGLARRRAGAGARGAPWAPPPAAGGAAPRSATAEAPPRPGLHDVHRQEQRERDAEHDERQGHRARV